MIQIPSNTSIMKQRNTISTLVAVLFFACNSQPATEDTEQSVLKNVRIVHPESKQYAHTIEYAGTLKPWREANLGTAIPGRVEKVFFEVGDLVPEGALIARLSAEPAIMAEVEKNALETDFNRVKRLRERGSVSAQEFDHLEAKYLAAVARHALMQKNTEVRAPFSGRLMEVMVQEGETFFFMPSPQMGMSFNPGIVRLMQTQVLKTVFHVPDTELEWLSKAKSVEIVVDALPDRRFNASIHSVSPMVSQTGRTVEVEVRMDDPDPALKVGMFARTRLVMPAEELLFVPAHAVREMEDRSYVWIVGDTDVAERRWVMPKVQHKCQMAVDGLHKDDRVVVSGISNIREGDRVAVHP